MPYNILVINPGSTSDDIGYYSGDKTIFEVKAEYSSAEVAPFLGGNFAKAAPLKKEMILKLLAEHKVQLGGIDAVIGRGGLTKPVNGGAYRVNEAMLGDLQSGKYGQHASNLGGILAYDIAAQAGKAIALISDSVMVDELSPLARYSGIPELPRISIFHALNQRRVAFLTAQKLGKKYEDCNFIVMHAGGGVTIGAHIKGRVADVNNGLDGEGPLTPQRAGTVPAASLAKICYGGQYTQEQLMLKLRGQGGVAAHTGTHDLRELSHFIDTGEKPADSTITCTREKAREARDAMIYQFAKFMGYTAAVAQGDLDAVILTGGLMKDPYVRQGIEARVKWLNAPIYVYPGSDEKAALLAAAQRVLQNPDTIQEYK